MQGMSALGDIAQSKQLTNIEARAKEKEAKWDAAGQIAGSNAGCWNP
jgi:hypothetical protein